MSMPASGRGERAAERVGELAAAPFATASAEQLAALVENDLEAPAGELCPAIARAEVRGCSRAGALTACLSGSGSAVFGLFAAEGTAEAAREEIAAAVRWTAVARLPRADAAATITA